MGTVIFDFDSTIISCESLEKILESQVSTVKSEEIKNITEAGIQGKISFQESLDQRLKIALPTREAVRNFGLQVKKWLTPGIDALIQKLHDASHQVWIVSGGLKESILPLSQALNVQDNNVLAVELVWDKDGQCLGIDPNDPFSRSKTEGLRQLKIEMTKPVIVIGDAMSDYRIFESGLSTHFILFTQHIKCQKLVNVDVLQAENIVSLQKELEGILDAKL